MDAIKKLYKLYISILTLIGAPILLLVIRIYMANIFWKSGVVKISNWNSTVYLFFHEYKVPFLPSEIAAYLATSIELIVPIFLILGILTRLAALPVFIMVIVIEFTFLELEIHYFWMMALATLMVFGGGSISLDRGIFWIINFYKKYKRHEKA